MNGFAIAPLQQWPSKLDELAAAHHAEWSALFGPHWSLDIVRGELQQSCGDAALPVSFVAIRDESLCGSVSLLIDDAEELRAFGSPWLGSLWVAPACRRRGLGARLVRHAMAEAAQRGVERLLLFTPRHADFYRRLGWRDLAQARVAGEPVDVMGCTLNAERAA